MLKYGTDPKHITKFMDLVYHSAEYSDYQGTVIWSNPPLSIYLAYQDVIEKDHRFLAVWINLKTQQCVMALKNED